MPSIRDDCRPTRNAVNARTVACVAVTHNPSRAARTPAPSAVAAEIRGPSVVSDSADVDFGGSERARAILGRVRIRSESDRDVFVGIATATDVDG